MYVNQLKYEYDIKRYILDIENNGNYSKCWYNQWKSYTYAEQQIRENVGEQRKRWTFSRRQSVGCFQHITSPGWLGMRTTCSGNAAHLSWHAIGHLMHRNKWFFCLQRKQAWSYTRWKQCKSSLTDCTANNYSKEWISN